MADRDELAHERLDGHERLCERRDRETEKRQNDLKKLIEEARTEIWEAIDGLRLDRTKGQRRIMYFMASVILALVGYIWKREIGI